MGRFETRNYGLVTRRFDFLRSRDREQVADSATRISRQNVLSSNLFEDSASHMTSVQWRPDCSLTQHMRHARIESARPTRGCSLIEVLVAMALFAVAAGVLAQLAAWSRRANAQAGRMSAATVVAQNKIEELLPDVGVTLNVSPAGALTNSLNGWFDVVDSRGRPGGGALPAAGPNFLRRWSVEPLADSDTLILRVVVTDASDVASAAGVERPNRVSLVAAKPRQLF
jgi:prepilin-type N-terminal cleavage/methylation domain-containing protein